MRNSGEKSEIELKEKREIENEWGNCGGIQEVNSAGQMGQLNSLRFKMRSGKRNLSRRGIGGISENEMPRARGMKFRKEKLTTDMGALRGELKSKLLETWGIRGDTFFQKYRMRNP